MAALPLLDAIQYPLPIYAHCTLEEILTVGGWVLVASVVILGLVSWLLIGSAWLGIAIALPLSFVLTRVAVGKLGRLKHNKPHGFYQQQLRGRLAAWGLYRLPHITRIGRWSIK